MNCPRYPCLPGPGSRLASEGPQNSLQLALVRETLGREVSGQILLLCVIVHVLYLTLQTWCYHFATIFLPLALPQ